jgi:hypothetical protein
MQCGVWLRAHSALPTRNKHVASFPSLSLSHVRCQALRGNDTRQTHCNHSFGPNSIALCPLQIRDNHHIPANGCHAHAKHFRHNFKSRAIASDLLIRKYYVSHQNFRRLKIIFPTEEHAPDGKSFHCFAASNAESSSKLPIVYIWFYFWEHPVNQATSRGENLI